MFIPKEYVSMKDPIRFYKAGVLFSLTYYTKRYFFIMI